MTCAAMGLLLRISYELDRARRQRGERTEMPRIDESGFTHLKNEYLNAAQKTAQLGKKRVEPKMGATV